MKSIAKIAIVFTMLFTFQFVTMYAQKKGKASIKKDVKSTYWFAGKNFVNARPVGSNPEEGGTDFLNINANKTADYKVGDIVEKMKWEVVKNNLTLTYIQNNRKVLFTIDKNFLTDEFGTKWTIKK